jgi:FkbM family methyltransferase
MGIIKSIKKRIQWMQHVQFDKRTGFYKYRRGEHDIFIRHPRHFVDKETTDWVSEKLYFHHYLPTKGDTVVDLGAGYAEESAYLKQKSSGFKYFGIEIQPIIYECLCNTYHGLGDSFKAVPYAIGDNTVFVGSQFGYASSGAQDQGYIETPELTWKKFLERYEIEKIDLLKMNIEGAEIHILNHIGDFSKIERMIISCHDFRANNGEGEQYRTKEQVLKVLKEKGYKIKTFSYGISWADDWIFAVKNK